MSLPTYTPVFLVKLTLDFCANIFGVPGFPTPFDPGCTATGTKCYNTYATCRKRANFLKTTLDYKIVSADIPGVPFREGERPYLKEIQWLATEIRDSLTISGRTILTFFDEPDTDIGIDPYYTTRSSIQGTFWGKFLARNPNYKGRPISIYRGAWGALLSAYTQIFTGVIDTISVNNDGTVTLEAKDLIGALADIQIPMKTDVSLVMDVDDAITTLTLAQPNETALPCLTSSGYLRIDDEIIQYASITGNVLEGCARAALGTTAAAHKANAKAQQVCYFVPANPYTHLKTMLLTDAAFDSSVVDTAAFDALAILDNMYVQMSAIITQPEALTVPYFELVELVGCKSWVAEDLKVTIAKNLVNFPGRTYVHFSREENIIDSTESVDLNANAPQRATTIQLYWDRLAIGALNDAAAHQRSRMRSAIDEESANFYNESIKQVIYCRWLRADYMDTDLIDRYIWNLLGRMLRIFKDPPPLFSFSVSAMDCTTKTGDFIRVSTSRLQDKTGAPISREVFQIIKRQDNGAQIDFTAQKYPRKRIFWVGANTLPVYTSASEAERESGFLSGTEETMSNGDAGYYLY